jgi:Sec-independent protein secretion pathway component TatC
MVILYELSLLACRIFLARRIKKQNAPDDEDEEALQAAQA